MTPRTALLTWTVPKVPPTGYLLSFDTPGGQIQVPHFTVPWLDLEVPTLTLPESPHVMLH